MIDRLLIDPAFEGDPAEVPAHLVAGILPETPDGDFTPNPGYLPSPRAMGWPEPLTTLESCLQLRAAGHLATAVLYGAMLRAPVLARGGEEGLAAVTADDVPVVPVYTHPDHLPEGGGWVIASGTALLDLPDDVLLAFDPGRASSFEVPVTTLRAYAAETAAIAPETATPLEDSK